MPASGPAHQSMARHGGIIVTRNTDEAMALANQAAPEHLVVGTEALARRVWNAGAVFVGGWTAQVAGDYAIGSNHVLPTAGAARFRGGLNERRLRQAGVSTTGHAPRPRPDREDDNDACKSRGPGRTREVDRSTADGIRQPAAGNRQPEKAEGKG